MTREELKAHCEKQIEMCEKWAICKGEKPSGKVYEEHKLILELLEQEPCEDDGVDHEKIRKVFAKESDIKKADIADMVTKVIMQAEEETDRFIFNTIRPYCEEITQQEISKEILSEALTQFFSKPTECDDAISREAVLQKLNELDWQELYLPIHFKEHIIDELPSVTPSRRKGRWIEERNDYGEIQGWHCDKCYEDSGFTTDCKWNYCPSCGAEMESEE